MRTALQKTGMDATKGSEKQEKIQQISTNIDCRIARPASPILKLTKKICNYLKWLTQQDAVMFRFLQVCSINFISFTSILQLLKFTFVKIAFTLSHFLTQNSHTFFTEFLHFPLSRYVAFTLPLFQTLTRTLTHRWIPFICTFQQASASFPRWNQVLRVLIRPLFLWGMGGWQQPGSGRDIRPSRLRRSLPGMLTCLRFIFIFYRAFLDAFLQ